MRTCDERSSLYAGTSTTVTSKLWRFEDLLQALSSSIGTKCLGSSKQWRCYGADESASATGRKTEVDGVSR